MLDSILQDPSRDKLTQMQKWFELDIRARGVPIDVRIMSILIKASLACLDGARLDRTLRRYLKYLDDLGPQIKEDVLASELFTHSEWCRILRMQPQNYSNPTEYISDPSQTLLHPSINSAPGNASETATETGDSPVPIDNDPLPVVRESTMRSQGLKTIRRSLDAVNLPVDLSATASHHTAHGRQLKLEQDSLTAAMDRWREEFDISQSLRSGSNMSQPLLGSWMYEWVQAMVPVLERETSAEQDKISRDHSLSEEELLLFPFLKLMPLQNVCATAVLSLLRTFFDPKVVSRGTGVPTIRQAAGTVGTDLLTEMKAEKLSGHFIQKAANHSSGYRRKLIAKLSKTPASRPNSGHSSHKGLRDGSGGLDPSFKIDPTIRFKLGALLLSAFLQHAKIPVTSTDPVTGQKQTVMQPAVTREKHWHEGKILSTVRIHQELMDRLKHEPLPVSIAKFPPMIVEPKKWENLQSGGYLTTSVCAVRLSDSTKSQYQYLTIADKMGHLEQVYKGLDVIGKVPWRINRDLLRIMINVWNTGEPIAKFAPEKPRIDLPPEPNSKDEDAHRKWRSLVRAMHNTWAAQHSQRCYQNFQLEIARSFEGESFYTPHNVDFRGRAYPIPPYFSHMGADYVRALFLFSKGKQLGENGLKWLKVHTANTYGFDKQSLRAREDFVQDHLKDVFESAENPLNGKQWWLQASDPWQCLAACIELKKALDSPVPTEFVSHLPIQQDGSCNGLQHYAALGGDEAGAAQVNLAPGDKPADVYSAVARMVSEEVRLDASNGRPEAKLLDGNLSRKVVKQTVMTNVYGVTRHGATSQIAKQLNTILPTRTLENKMQTVKLASYVAGLVFKSLKHMFGGAHAIQEWLGECGIRISKAITPEQVERIQDFRRGVRAQKKLKWKSTGGVGGSGSKDDEQFKSTVVWTTPLGLPVVQPYRESRTMQIKTCLQSINVRLPGLYDPVNKRQQLQAFPPNFIHSLDASHMMLSALKCNDLGLTFAAVHDSFWTHADDVPMLNRVLRDAMVRMHSEDIIGRLREEFNARYRGCLCWMHVSRNTEVGRRLVKYYKGRKRRLTDVASSRVTGETQIDDLIEESERQRLLGSDDVEEVRRGKEMVTAASVFEEASGNDEEAARVAEDEDSRESMILSEFEKQGATSGSLSTDVPTKALGKQEEELESFDVSVPEEELSLEEPDDSVTTEDSGDGQMAESHSSLSQKPPAEEEEAAKDAELREAQKEKEKKKKAREAREAAKKIYFWAPISFPTPPKKGTFDVSRLKESVYFFS